jgi:general secretion pathway protein J
MTAQQRRRHSKNRVAGFTLLEALIAMALMGLILAALATVTAQWLPNWNHGMILVQRHEKVALAFERLIADLAAAEFIPVNRESRRPLFEGAGRSVTFVRVAAGPDAGPGLEIIRIAEDTDAREAVTVRTRAPFAPASSDGFQRGRTVFGDPVVLLRAPYRLKFLYAGRDRIWRETWQDELELPQAIKFTLHDATTQQQLSLSTATSVHARISVECLAAKSLDECLTVLSRPAETDENKSRS